MLLEGLPTLPMVCLATRKDLGVDSGSSRGRVEWWWRWWWWWRQLMEPIHPGTQDHAAPSSSMPLEQTKDSDLAQNVRQTTEVKLTFSASSTDPSGTFVAAQECLMAIQEQVWYCANILLPKSQLQILAGITYNSHFLSMDEMSRWCQRSKLWCICKVR